MWLDMLVADLFDIVSDDQVACGMFVCPPTVQTGKFRATDVQAMRAQNIRVVMRLVHENAGISRADIARKSGLSRSTVGDIVQSLVADGVVFEEHVHHSKNGRPPIALRIDEGRAFVVGVDLGVDRLNVIVMDLKGNVLASHMRQHDVESDPDGTIRKVVREIPFAVASLGLQIGCLGGIGVAVRCPLDPETPDQLSERILPAWKDVRLGGRLHEVFGVPVFVENDANLGALAEFWWGQGQGLGDFALIRLANGIGAGLVVGGAIYRGATGIAGEIGHTTIDPSGPLCRCGLRGCLEAMIGPHILAGVDQASAAEELVSSAHSGDKTAAETMDRTGAAIGIAVANLVNLMNPQAVVLSGELTRVGPLLVEPIERMLRSRALWSAVDETKVVISDLGPQAVALGAATMVLDTVLDNPAILPSRFPPRA